jgi:hypothetical protein
LTDALDRIRGAAEELRRIAGELRNPEVSDARAAELAREAAEVVSGAGNEIDRALAEADAEEA